MIITSSCFAIEQTTFTLKKSRFLMMLRSLSKNPTFGALGPWPESPRQPQRAPGGLQRGPWGGVSWDPPEGPKWTSKWTQMDPTRAQKWPLVDDQRGVGELSRKKKQRSFPLNTNVLFGVVAAIYKLWEAIWEKHVNTTNKKKAVVPLHKKELVFVCGCNLLGVIKCNVM